MVGEGNIGFGTGGGRVGDAETIDTKDTDDLSRRLALAEERRKPALSGLGAAKGSGLGARNRVSSIHS
jgi:hypothetical protein